MALTYDEQLRLKNAEETIQQLKTLIDGAGSKNQLKQITVKVNEQLRRMNVRLAEAEAEVQELLVLARNLQ